MTRRERPAATETPRQAIQRHLAAGAHTAHTLSALVGVAERDVTGHLEHLARSLHATGRRLVVEPARCLGCDYVFRGRERLAKPSACPRCRGQHLSSPVFSIAGPADGPARSGT